MATDTSLKILHGGVALPQHILMKYTRFVSQTISALAEHNLHYAFTRIIYRRT